MILRRLAQWLRPAGKLLVTHEVEPVEPLSTAELQEISGFLRRHDVHRGFLADIYALDGFLTCVVIGPEAIPATEWMMALFAGTFPAVEGSQLDHQFQLITRRLNLIATQFLRQPLAYQPLFETHPGLGQNLRPLDAWCQGFMTATMLRDAQWETMLHRSDAALWLYPIWERASAAGDKPSKKRTARKAGAQGAFNATQLKAAVLRMRNYWVGQVPILEL